MNGATLIHRVKKAEAPQHRGSGAVALSTEALNVRDVLARAEPKVRPQRGGVS